jgi:hypothetical protein
MENENSLIDVNDALKVLCGHCGIDFNACKRIGYCAEYMDIKRIPVVDAVEVKCKVGDWVYALWEAPVKQKYIIYCAELKEIRIGMRNCRLTTTYRFEPIMYRGHIHEYRDDDFGKLVFPSEKEAEVALAKMDGGNEDE